MQFDDTVHFLVPFSGIILVFHNVLKITRHEHFLVFSTKKTTEFVSFFKGFDFYKNDEISTKPERDNPTKLDFFKYSFSID